MACGMDWPRECPPITTGLCFVYVIGTSPSLSDDDVLHVFPVLVFACNNYDGLFLF